MRNLHVLLALHPGTMDTNLPAPFQRKVPEGKLLSTEFVAERLLGVIENTEANDSGSFLDWDYKPIPGRQHHCRKSPHSDGLLAFSVISVVTSQKVGREMP